MSDVEDWISKVPQAEWDKYAEHQVRVAELDRRPLAHMRGKPSQTPQLRRPEAEVLALAYTELGREVLVDEARAELQQLEQEYHDRGGCLWLRVDVAIARSRFECLSELSLDLLLSVALAAGEEPTADPGETCTRHLRNTIMHAYRGHVYPRQAVNLIRIARSGPERLGTPRPPLPPYDHAADMADCAARYEAQLLQMRAQRAALTKPKELTHAN